MRNVAAARPIVVLGDLTCAQRLFLGRLAGTALADRFYLSGGTALSAFHLRHRKSDDLDLFTREPVDTRAVLQLVNAVGEEPAIPRRVQDRLGFLLHVGGEPLRVEFVRYEFDHLDAPVARYGRLRVDGCATSWRTNSRRPHDRVSRGRSGRPAQRAGGGNFWASERLVK
jgi:hypothetical protein